MSYIYIYRFLKCQFYFSYICEKIANIRKYRKNDEYFPIVNSVKCTVLVCFRGYSTASDTASQHGLKACCEHIGDVYSTLHS